MRRTEMKFPVMGVALLLVLGGVAACDRASETDDYAELDREMDMALEGDTLAEPELRDVPREESPAAERPRTERPTAVAPRPETPREQPPATVMVTAAQGSTFRIVLDQELSTRTNESGDLFTAMVVDAVTDGRRVAIPQGAAVRGQVTAVQKSGSRGEQAIIKIDFSEVSFDGRTYPLRATVVEANPETKSRTTTAGRAARIGGGAAAGAILGRVIGGDTKGAVIGAAVGAAAGTAITLGTEDVDAILPAGSEMTIRLDEPVVMQVPAS